MVDARPYTSFLLLLLWVALGSGYQPDQKGETASGYYNPERQVYDVSGHRRLSGSTVLTNVGLVNAFGKPHAYLSGLPIPRPSQIPPLADDTSANKPPELDIEDSTSRRYDSSDSAVSVRLTDPTASSTGGSTTEGSELSIINNNTEISPEFSPNLVSEINKETTPVTTKDTVTSAPSEQGHSVTEDSKFSWTIATRIHQNPLLLSDGHSAIVIPGNKLHDSAEKASSELLEQNEVVSTTRKAEDISSQFSTKSIINVKEDTTISVFENDKTTAISKTKFDMPSVNLGTEIDNAFIYSDSEYEKYNSTSLPFSTTSYTKQINELVREETSASTSHPATEPFILGSESSNEQSKEELVHEKSVGQAEQDKTVTQTEPYSISEDEKSSTQVQYDKRATQSEQDLTTISKVVTEDEQDVTNEIPKDPGLLYRPSAESFRQTTTEDRTVQYTVDDSYLKSSTASGTPPVELFSNHGFIVTSTDGMLVDKKDTVMTPPSKQETTMTKDEETSQDGPTMAEVVFNNQYPEKIVVDQVIVRNTTDKITNLDEADEDKPYHSTPLSSYSYHLLIDNHDKTNSVFANTDKSLIPETATEYNIGNAATSIKPGTFDTTKVGDEDSERNSTLTPQMVTKNDFIQDPNTVLISSNYPPISVDTTKTEITFVPLDSEEEKKTTVAHVTKGPYETTTILIASNYPPEHSQPFKGTHYSPQIKQQTGYTTSELDGFSTTYTQKTPQKPEVEINTYYPSKGGLHHPIFYFNKDVLKPTEYETTTSYSITKRQKPQMLTTYTQENSQTPEVEITSNYNLNEEHNTHNPPKGGLDNPSSYINKYGLKPAEDETTTSYTAIKVQQEQSPQGTTEQDIWSTNSYSKEKPDIISALSYIHVLPYQSHNQAYYNNYQEEKEPTVVEIFNNVHGSTTTIKPSTSKPTLVPHNGPVYRPTFAYFKPTTTTISPNKVVEIFNNVGSSESSQNPKADTTQSSNTSPHPTMSTRPLIPSTSGYKFPIPPHLGSTSGVMEIFNNVAPTAQGMKTSNVYKSTTKIFGSSTDKTPEKDVDTIIEVFSPTTEMLIHQDVHKTIQSTTKDYATHINNQKYTVTNPWVTVPAEQSSRFPSTSISVVTSIYEETNPFEFSSTSTGHTSNSDSANNVNKVEYLQWIPAVISSELTPDSVLEGKSNVTITDTVSSIVNTTTDQTDSVSLNETNNTTSANNTKISSSTTSPENITSSVTSTLKPQNMNSTTKTPVANSTLPVTTSNPASSTTRPRPTRPFRPTRPRPRPTRPTPPTRRPARPSTTKSPTTRPPAIRNTTTTSTTPRPTTKRRPPPTRRTTPIRPPTSPRPSTTTPVGFLTQPSYFPQLHHQQSGTKRPGTTTPSGFLTQPSYFPQLSQSSFPSSSSSSGSSSGSQAGFDINNLNSACQRKISNGTIWRATPVPGSAGCGYRCYTGLFAYSTFTMSDETSCGEGKKCINGKCSLEDDIATCRKASNGRPVSNVGEILCRAVCSFEGASDRVVPRQEGTPCSPLGFFRCSNGLCLPGVVAT